MNNPENLFLFATLIMYIVAAIFYTRFIFGWKKSDTVNVKSKNIIAKTGNAAVVLTWLGFGTNTAAIMVRTLRAGHLPLANMYEFLLFFIWGIIFMYLLVEYKYRLKQIGFFILPMSIGLMLWLFTMNKDISPLMPSLRSNWLYFHVITAVIAYGAFAVSFVIAIMYLLKERAEKEDNADKTNNKSFAGLITDALPPLVVVEEMSYRLVITGMPFLTLVIVTGAVWAEIAWGSYWSWDPKETWALITWLIYAGYLHARITGRWKGRFSMILLVIGFVIVMFTFAGVSLLMPSLHSYL